MKGRGEGGGVPKMGRRITQNLGGGVPKMGGGSEIEGGGPETGESPKIWGGSPKLGGGSPKLGGGFHFFWGVLSFCIPRILSSRSQTNVYKKRGGRKG